MKQLEERKAKVEAQIKEKVIEQAEAQIPEDL